MDDDLKIMVNKLLTEQRLAVLSSNMNDQPYPSLVAFVHTDNLKNLFFATLRDSIKYKNIMNNPKVSMLIDNRDNSPSDFSVAIAVSVLGTASEIDTEINKIKDLYLSKHPYLKDFIEMQGCALLKIEVEKFKVISKFQNEDVLVIN